MRRQTKRQIAGGMFGTKAVTIADLDNFMEWLSTESGTRRLPQSLYAAVAWTFWSVNLRANNISAIPFGVYTADSKEDVDEALVDWPINMLPTMWDVEAWLSLVGAAYILKRDNDVTVAELQVLNANTMRVERVGPEGPELFKQVVGSHVRFYEAEQIVYFRTFNPKDDVNAGVSSGQVASLSGSLILHSNEWASRFFKNGAIPATILQTDGQVKPAERDRIKTVWNRSFQKFNQWATAILTKGMTAKIIGQPISDLAMPDLAKEQKEEILAAHNIPPGLAEAKTNRAERELLQYELWTDSLIPYTKARLVPVLNEQLFNPLGLRISYQYNKIEAIQREETRKAKAMADIIVSAMLPSLRARAINVAEYRRVLDRLLEWMALPRLDEHFVPDVAALPELQTEEEKAIHESNRFDWADAATYRVRAQAVGAKVSKAQ